MSPAPGPAGPRLHSVRVGLPRTLDEDDDPWVTSSFKELVSGPVFLARENLAGDAQGDLTVHGGPDKAVCVYPLAHYAGWRVELAEPRCGPGWFGENFTVEGQVEDDVAIGDRFRVGAALVEVSQPRTPCWKLARRWNRPDILKRVVRSGRSGWYVRVIDQGLVATGDSLELVARPFPRWTITTVNTLAHSGGDATAAVSKARRELARCPALSAAWRGWLSGDAADD